MFLRGCNERRISTPTRCEQCLPKAAFVQLRSKKRSGSILPGTWVSPIWTAIWFVQCVGRERRLVDYYEGSGVGLYHYAQVLHDKRIKHGWKYGDHYFPHDIKIREFSSGISRVQSLAALGIGAIAVPQSNVLDGINLTRRMLGRTWIDRNRCERGIEALRQYRREYDDRLKDWC